ncbi:MAG: hypothetical protein AAFQ53_17750, partial [Bacteroidota bacterium]
SSHIRMPGAGSEEIEGVCFAINVFGPDWNGKTTLLAGILEGFKLEIINLASRARDHSMAAINATVATAAPYSEEDGRGKAELGDRPTIRESTLRTSIEEAFGPSEVTVTRLLVDPNDVYDAGKKERVIKVSALCKSNTPGLLQKLLVVGEKAGVAVREADVRGTVIGRDGGGESPTGDGERQVNRVSIIFGVSALGEQECEKLISQLQGVRGFLRRPQVTAYGNAAAARSS